MIVTTDARRFELYDGKLHNHPFLAWENLAKGATLSGTALASGSLRENGTNGDTSTYWAPVSSFTTAVFKVDLGAPQVLSCAALAAHNLADFGLRVAVDWSDDDSAWTPATVEHVPEDNATLCFRFSRQAARYWRFRILDVDPADSPAVGVFFLGAETILTQRIYKGYRPVISPTEIRLNANVAERGDLISSSVISRGARLEADLTLLQPDFVRGALAPFIRHFNSGGGVFFAWCPDDFAEDVHYCWSDGSIVQPTNTGPRARQSLSFGARVYHDW